MQLESDLFYNENGVDAKGFHDPVGRCFQLKAGSSGIRCENLKRDFFGLPTIQMIYNADIIPNVCSAGDDTKFYLQKDLRCYPTDNYDELSVAATLITGKLIRGENVWKNTEGISVKKLKSSIIENNTFDEMDSSVQKYEDAAQKTFDIIISKDIMMKNVLSLAYHLKNSLGTKNEDRFTVPRQVDHCMKKFGFLCEEEKAYDLVIPDVNYTISDKMGNFLFHTSKKSRSGYIKENLQMSNTRSGQSSDSHQRPQFDCLLVMQYIPFLVCGVAPYHKIVTHFKHSDGGWVLKKVPVDSFRYILSPTENIPPNDISLEIQNKIDDFVEVVKGGFMPNLIDNIIKLD